MNHIGLSQGYPSDVIAGNILKSTANDAKTVVMADAKTKAAVYLRLLWPSFLYVEETAPFHDYCKQHHVDSYSAGLNTQTVKRNKATSYCKGVLCRAWLTRHFIRYRYSQLLKMARKGETPAST